MPINRAAYEAVEPETTDLERQETGHFFPYRDSRTVPLSDPRKAYVLRLRITIFRCGACGAKTPSLERLKTIHCDETLHPPFTL